MSDKRPVEHAKDTGLLTTVSGKIKFQVANVLYGWGRHDYNFALTPFTLSEDDFECAMIAAAEYPTEPPFWPALPEIQREKFEDFVPMKATK